MEKFIHAFWLAEGMHYRALKKVRAFFGDFEKAWKRGTVAYFVKAGLSAELSASIVAIRGKVDFIRELKKLEAEKITLVGRDAEEFPLVLKEIADPPFLLYRKGAALRPDFQGIAMVGTRIPSFYGTDMAAKIAQKICGRRHSGAFGAGAVIVSGLAYGVDAIAHEMAVEEGVPTVAFLASGLAKITPYQHTGLAARIVAGGGTLFSEYPQYDGAHRYRFLERNRLISGLCKATIVIEACGRSGALITARHAFEQNRDVYALVGDIERPQAEGCLRLIADDMARPIVSVDGLVKALGLEEGFGDFCGERERALLAALGI